MNTSANDDIVSALALPAFSGDATPEFTTVKGCKAWLQALPLINVGPSHGQILSEIEELNLSDIPGLERLGILEVLLDGVIFVQTEQAKKFSGRAIPMLRPEREILLAVNALWSAMSLGYRHAMASLTGDKLARACQRALWCAAQILYEHGKCYLEVAPEHWAALHRLYLFAESHRIAPDPVDHPVQKANDKTSCMDIYAQVLLFCCANTNERSARQLAVTTRWLDRWGHKVVVTPERPSMPIGTDGQVGARPLGAWLSKADGARRIEAGAAGSDLRYLDVDDLSNTIRKRISRVRKGESPESLGLGSDLAAQSVESLLETLHQHWCEDRQARLQPRKAADSESTVITGMATLHYQISGQLFRQPIAAKELTTAQRQEIATFGRVATREEDELQNQLGASLETWSILDESLTGVRLIRKAGNSRYTHGQLIAIRPKDAKSYLLGTVRWLSMDANYLPKIGVHTMPGVPHGTCVRATGLNAMNDKYVPALVLDAVPALKSPATLVLPMNWYKPNRVVEIFRDHAHSVRLTAILERGTDFERVSFEPA